jgi:LPXTG-motif cell wall-anchored protein
MPSRISGQIWLDSNRDGVRDPGESLISGIKVELLNNNGDVIAVKTTTADGRYSFDDLVAGVYRVRITYPEGSAGSAQNLIADPTVNSDMQPTTGLSEPIILAAGESVTQVDAGLYSTGKTDTGVLGTYIPKTGENDGLLTWAAGLLLLATAGTLTLLIKRRKKQR